MALVQGLPTEGITVAAGACASSFAGLSPCSPVTCRQMCGWQTTQWLCGLFHVTHIPGFNHTASCVGTACNEAMVHRQGEP